MTPPGIVKRCLTSSLLHLARIVSEAYWEVWGGFFRHWKGSQLVPCPFIWQPSLTRMLNPSSYSRLPECFQQTSLWGKVGVEPRAVWLPSYALRETSELTLRNPEKLFLFPVSKLMLVDSDGKIPGEVILSTPLSLGRSSNFGRS